MNQAKIDRVQSEIAELLELPEITKSRFARHTLQEAADLLKEISDGITEQQNNESLFDDE